MPRSIAACLDNLSRAHPGQSEYARTARHFLVSLASVLDDHPEFDRPEHISRIIQPVHAGTFRIDWNDDRGERQANRGWYAVFGISSPAADAHVRFHPAVTPDLVNTLAFDRMVVNALADCPGSGAAVGADFDNRRRSHAEITRFCAAFMNELHRSLGEATPAPAAGFGLGRSELTCLAEHYRALTGKPADPDLDGMFAVTSGYACALLADTMFDSSLTHQRVAVSGSGVLAVHAAEKISALGANVVSISNSFGFVTDERGLAGEKMIALKSLAFDRSTELRAFADRFPSAAWSEGSGLWRAVSAEIALPCATQHELDAADAGALLDHGCRCVCEGARHALTPEAVELLEKADVPFVPALASRAVALRVRPELKNRPTADVLDTALARAVEAVRSLSLANHTGKNFARGLNAAAFLKLADTL